MRSKAWKVWALLALLLPGVDAMAQESREDRDIWDENDYSFPGWYCEECRDPYQYPVDYAAFAYNAYFGENAWALASNLGIPFRIYNRDAEWVVVWFTDFLFGSPSLLPDTLNVRIRLPNGEVVTVTVLQNGPDMPLEPRTDSPPACLCGGGDEGDDFEEALEDDEPVDWEEPEPEGIVEIVDADENGEFPDFEREL